MREWLKNARIAMGYTMKEMSVKLHISESYYCSIENGYRQREMDILLAGRLSEILDLPIKAILAYEEAMRTAKETTNSTGAGA